MEMAQAISGLEPLLFPLQGRKGGMSLDLQAAVCFPLR